MIPGNQRPRFRWIVRQRPDGRFVIRCPKRNVMIKDLYLKRDADFGLETLLPIGSYIYQKKKTTQV
jgi:hypothetical protein